MHKQYDPAVEDILASIKKVIERDNRETARGEQRRRADEGMMLGSPQGTPFVPTRDAGEYAVSRETGDNDEILELDDDAAMPDDADTQPAAAHDQAQSASPQPEATRDIIAEIERTLTSDRAADSMRRSLSGLARAAEPTAGQNPLPAGETSLEQLVRDMLRPMLAGWLDAHLPPIVERLVKAEIARIAGEKR